MPIFEFTCTKCGRPFEELLRSAGAVNEVACPACGSPEVKKKVSTFASKISGSASLSLGSGSSAACSPGGV